MSRFYLTEGDGAVSLSQQPYLSQLDYEIIKAVHEGIPSEQLAKRLGVYPYEIDILYGRAMERLHGLSQLTAPAKKA